LTPEVLTREITSLLGSPRTLEAMARASLASGMPDALDRVVACVEGLIQG
jgi:UDP-N-acetylglucosamine:LPS N-acetylglucosamine transferase